eukprot:COSAG01_NODE_67000_length_268_cov_0.863905_1_plen_29_part_01
MLAKIVGLTAAGVVGCAGALPFVLSSMVR